MAVVLATEGVGLAPCEYWRHAATRNRLVTPLYFWTPISETAGHEVLYFELQERANRQPWSSLAVPQQGKKFQQSYVVVAAEDTRYCGT